jgi:hypothetical protein
MDISFNCSKCGQSMVIDEDAAGVTIDCPNCGEPSHVPSQSMVIADEPEPLAIATPPPIPEQPALQISPPSPLVPKAAVVITDIQMPFGRMVVFMVKWAIASIPAAIVLMTVFFLLWTLFGLLGTGLMIHGLR